MPVTPGTLPETRMWPNTTPWIMAQMDNTRDGVKNAERNVERGNHKRWEVPVVGWLSMTLGGSGAFTATPLIIDPVDRRRIVPAHGVPEFEGLVNTLAAEDENQPEFTLINIRNILAQIRDKM